MTTTTSRTRGRAGAIVCAAGLAPFVAAAGAAAQIVPMDNVFPFELPGYSKAEQVQNVGGMFPNATADIAFNVSGGKTTVDFSVADAPPEMYFTAWLKLDGQSPLTGFGSTALAGTSEIAQLGMHTPSASLTPAANALGIVGDDGTGSLNGANGFFTDSSGAATLSITLDFPVTPGGVYPFSAFDPSLPDVPLGDQPFSVALVSHAVDQIGHGLDFGVHEPFFFTQKLVPGPGAAGAITLAGALGLRRRRRGG